MLMNKQVSSVDPVSSKWFLKNLAVLESILIKILHQALQCNVTITMTPTLNGQENFKLSMLLAESSVIVTSQQTKCTYIIIYLLVILIYIFV